MGTTLMARITPTPEERALFIGEKLGLVKLGRKFPAGHFYTINNTYGECTRYDVMEWISSPDGLHAVENAMIGRGYDIFIDYNHRKKLWECEFCKGGFDNKNEYHNKSKSEAILNAAYLALKGEEDGNP